MHSRSNLARGALVAGVSWATLVAAPGSAVAEAPGEAAQLQEIVVTARRTDEALQTTPVAVTAISSVQLAERQVTQVSDLQRAAPSLSIMSGGVGAATTLWLSMRGQTVSDPGSLKDAAVATYLDGVYVARPLVGNLGFLDMQSVEVLRGPQGTLFGRNTTGGALNLITAQPVDRQEGYAKAGYGNFNSKVVEGVVNLPVGEELAARFAGRYHEHDGYFPNPALGHPNGAVKHDVYVRGAVKWEPTSLPLVWTVGGDYAEYRDTGNGTAVMAINPASPLAMFYGLSQATRSGALPANTPIPLGPGFSVPAGAFAGFTRGPIGPIEQYLNPQFATAAQRGILLSKNWRYSFNSPISGYPPIDDQASHNTAWSATSNLAIDLGAVRVKSITGFRRSSTNSNLDLTGANTGAIGFISYYRQHQFSEELQVSGDVGKLQYIFGGIYFREAGAEQSDQAIFFGTPLASSNRDAAGYVSTSKGLFAQVNYNLSDALRVTGGVRYTWDTRSVNRHGYTSFLGGGAAVCTQGPQTGTPVNLVGTCQNPESAKFSYPAWTASIDYKLSRDVFIYVKTSGASRSGGFNTYVVPPPYSSSFEPEDVRDVEGGFKGEFLDHRLRTNVAVFHSWTSDVQRSVSTTYVNSQGVLTPTQFITNAGDVTASGVEFEGELLPWRGMNLSGSVAYLDAKYKKGSRTENQLVNGRLVPVDRSGEPITFAAKWNASISATQTLDLGSGKLKLHLDYAYISGRYYDYYTTGDPAQAAAWAISNAALRLRGYGLLNGQVAFTFDDPKVEVALWGRNLLNKANFTAAYSTYTSLGSAVQFQGPPRTFGATVSYSW